MSSTTTTTTTTTSSSTMQAPQPTSWGILSRSTSDSNLQAGGSDVAKQDGSMPTWTAPLYASANGNNFTPGDTVDLNEIFAGT